MQNVLSLFAENCKVGQKQTAHYIFTSNETCEEKGYGKRTEI